jgi:predicted metal-dependent HD superfamily phosphohydrolase
MLKDVFIPLVLKYTNDHSLAQTLFIEIEKAYSGSGRYYHNSSHLLNMYNELLPVKELITDWDTLLFSLFYHDIVYKATGKDNEEKSAALAVKRLSAINFPLEKIALCSEQIVATKHHMVSANIDTNFLLDADMSILGYPWQEYETYYKSVRKEYALS